MTELTYTQQGDYLIPNLQMGQSQPEPLGRYGSMRRAFLREHRELTYSHLCLTEQLFPHLQEVQRTATQRMEQLMTELLRKNPPPNKETDQLGWVRHLNSLKAQAEEIIQAELIYI